MPTVSFEPNDSISAAAPTDLDPQNRRLIATAAIGDNPNLLLSPGLDVDLFQIDLNVGDELSIDIDTDAADLNQIDTVLRLFDGAGNLLGFADDVPAPGEDFSRDAFLTFSAAIAGTYYIGVSDYFNYFYDPFREGSGFVGNTGAYRIEFTLTPPNQIAGTADDDYLVGSDRADRISALAGDDTVLAGAGNDQIAGGSGEDLLSGGDGADVIEAESGDDDVSGGGGDDTLAGGDGVDAIAGEGGNDTLAGGRGKDRISGGFGSDTIAGNDGNDLLDGGDDADLLFGGSGKDRMGGGFGSDVLYGEAGQDILNGSFDSDFLDGGDGSDRLFGDDGSDTLFGGLGSDRLQGGAGFDGLDGGEGNDELIGVDAIGRGSGFGAFEVDTLTGGLGSDTFILGGARPYYDDGDRTTSGDQDYALITDFDANQDVIQLKGAAALYQLDFFTSVTGVASAAIVYDPGAEARGELIAIVEGAADTLRLSSRAFRYV